MSTFGERLRAERVRAGLSQTELAAELMSPSYVSLMESGRRVPADDLLEVIATRLGTTADYLLNGAQAPSEERARLEVEFAKLALANGEPRAARDRLRALDLSAITDQHRGEALHTLASAHEALGELDDAVPLLESLLEDARAQHRPLDAAQFAMDLVGIYHEAGNLSRAVSLGEEVLAQVESDGISGTDEHLRLAATLLWSYYERGDLLFATHRAKELIDLAEAHGTVRGRGGIYWNASLIAEGRGDVVGARLLAQRAMACMGEAGSARDVPRLRMHYAWLLLRGVPPEPAKALEELEVAADGLVNVGSLIEHARVGIEQARAHLLLGHYAVAETLARTAIDTLGDNVAQDMCEARIVLGDIREARGDLAGAEGHYRWAADRLAMMAAGRAAASLWSALGDRFTDHGDHAGASRAYRSALAEAGIRVRDADVAPTPGPTISELDAAHAGATGR